MCNSLILATLANAVWSTLNQTLGEFNQHASRMTIKKGRIIGGKDIMIEEVPYQISLHHNGSLDCGGSIISAKWVLTAAHCVEGYELNSISIRAGSNKFDTGGSLHKAAAAIYHPKFNLKNFDYDIGLIKVDPPFQFGKHVKVIKLPEEESKPKEGAIGIVTGWGTITPWENLLPDQLQFVELPIVGRKKCQEGYPHLVVTKHMVCAGYLEGRRDACQGDSGGPMASDGILVGIVSWGLGCATAGRFGVYTDISTLRSWIKKRAGI